MEEGERGSRMLGAQQSQLTIFLPAVFSAPSLWAPESDYNKL